MKRIKSLDSLRGIASLIVVVFHVLISFIPFYDANYLNRYESQFIKVITLSPLKLLWAGNEVVLLFFVLSGFVAMLPYLQGRQKPYREYFVKRFFRLYAPFVIIMGLSALLVAIFSRYNNIQGMSSAFDNRWAETPRMEEVLSHLLLINLNTSNTNGVVWTLFHEMRISLIMPLFLMVTQKFRLNKSFLINVSICLTGFLSMLVIGRVAGNGFLSLVLYELQMTAYYSIFAIFGAYLAKYVYDFSILNSRATRFSMLAVSLLIIEPRWLLVPLGLDHWIISNLFTLVGLLALIAVVIHSATLDSLLTTRPLLKLGELSYSIYLVHIPMIMLSTILFSDSIGVVPSLVLAMALTIPASKIVNETIIKQTVKWGDFQSRKSVKQR